MKYPLNTIFGKNRRITNDRKIYFEESVKIIGYFEEEKEYWLKSIQLKPGAHHNYYMSLNESQLDFFIESKWFWFLEESNKTIKEIPQTTTTIININSK